MRTELSPRQSRPPSPACPPRPRFYPFATCASYCLPRLHFAQRHSATLMRPLRRLDATLRPPASNLLCSALARLLRLLLCVDPPWPTLVNSSRLLQSPSLARLPC